MIDGSLRVLALVTDSWGSEGGISQFNRDLMGGLGSAPHVGHVEVASYRDASPTRPLPEKVTMCRANGSRVRLALACAQLAWRARPDIVFCGHLHLAPLAAIVARASGAPLWLQLHGIEAWDRPSRARRSAAESATLVTAVSRYTAHRFREWAKVSPERVRVLPNTVAAGFHTAPVDCARLLRLGLSGAERFLLTVGRLSASERYKGHDLVIPLMPSLRAQHPDLLYVIAGDGEDRGRLELLAAAHGVTNAVRFVGQVAADDLADLYRAASAFVMPSTGEGFGIAYLEALACGTPVVALASGGAVDPLRDGVLGRCVDRGQLEAAIRETLAVVPDRESLARLTTTVFAVGRQANHAARLVHELAAR